jgi:aspartyl protease family protein
MTVRRLLWILLTILAAILFLLVAKNDGAVTAGTRQPDLVSLTVKIALAVFVGALVLTLLRERFSRALENAMVWVAVALLLAVGYGFRAELRDVSERLMADYMPSRLAPRNRVVEITRGGQGNFALAAHLNSARVSMVLDTGATSVVLTQDAARAAGLPVEVLTYTVAIDTANGRTRAAPVTLNSITVGGIVERSVPALIAQPGQLRTNLLGMTFLNRLESWEVRGDKLVMRAYP